MQKLLVMVLSLTVTSVSAGDFEDGVAEHKKGNYPTALSKFKLAAGQGNADARYYLGVMYERSRGTEKDYVRAHMWLNLAAVAGNAMAGRNRDVISAQMTPQQIAEAQKMAKDCQAQNFKNCN